MKRKFNISELDPFIHLETPETPQIAKQAPSHRPYENLSTPSMGRHAGFEVLRWSLNSARSSYDKEFRDIKAFASEHFSALDYQVSDLISKSKESSVFEKKCKGRKVLLNLNIVGRLKADMPTESADEQKFK